MKTSSLARIVVFVLASVLGAIGSYYLYQLVYEVMWSPTSILGGHYDFVAYYSAGVLVLQGHVGWLYDASTMMDLQRQYLPAGAGGLVGYLPFLNPPFVGVLLAPLALGPLVTVRETWFLINSMMAIVIAWWLSRGMRLLWQRIVAGFLIATSLPFYQVLAEGQISIIILFGSLCALWLFERGRPFWAGACLVVLCSKPQLALLAGLGFLVFRQWRVLGGMVSAVMTLVVLTLPVTGMAVYGSYAQYLWTVTTGHFVGIGPGSRVAWQGPVSQMIGLNGMYDAYFGHQNVRLVNGLAAVTAVALLALCGLAVRRVGPSLRSTSGRLLLVSLLILGLLLDPHAFIQDAVLLFVPLAVLLRTWPGFTSVTLFVMFVQLLAIDQRIAPVHLVTLGLIAYVAVVSSLAVAGKLPDPTTEVGRFAA